MAIKINVKVTFAQDKFLAKLGMMPASISALTAQGITIIAGLDGLSMGDADGLNVVDLQIPTNIALSVQAGNIVSPKLITSMREAILDAMGEIFDDDFDIHDVFAIDPLENKSLGVLLNEALGAKSLKGALDLLPKGKNIKDVKAEIEADKMHAATATVSAAAIYPECTDEEIASAPAVQLRYAKRLYQPVKGTSANSRYFMIAAKPGLRVAARWRKKDGQLSIRVEGDDLANHKSQLKEIGMDVKGDYASLHINVNPILAKKTVGSLLLALGDLETGIPNIEKVVH